MNLSAKVANCSCQPLLGRINRPQGRTKRYSQKGVRAPAKAWAHSLAVDEGPVVGIEAVERGAQREAVGAHGFEYDVIVLLDRVGQKHRARQHVDCVAGRSENLERLQFAGAFAHASMRAEAVDAAG